jgi:hypothetical protein
LRLEFRTKSEHKGDMNLLKSETVQIFWNDLNESKISLMKRLREDLTQGMLAIFCCRIFCLQFGIQKYND